jgi:hypothetical protein
MQTAKLDQTGIFDKKLPSTMHVIGHMRISLKWFCFGCQCVLSSSCYRK